MTKRKWTVLLVSLGVVFLLNAVLGRYLVLPGYLAGLEQGFADLGTASQSVSIWKVLRYLLWGYSYKLGLYFLVLGFSLRTAMEPRRRWLLAIGGLLYVGFAYIPLPVPGSIVFGVAGVVMTLLMLSIFWRWSSERARLAAHEQRASDFRMAGYFFFAMATYTLCPLLGVKGFALQPELMIRYGLQGEAASLALHLVIELILGWLFLALGHWPLMGSQPSGVQTENGLRSNIDLSS